MDYSNCTTQDPAPDNAPPAYDSMGIKQLKEMVIRAIGQFEFEKRCLLEKSEFVRVLRERDEAVEAAKNSEQGISRVLAGKYILGDPCYLACDVNELECFSKSYYQDSDDDDDDDDSAKKPHFNHNTPVVAFNTADSTPSSYALTDRSGTYTITVNTSVIAIVNLAYNPNYSKTDAVMVEFHEPTRCYAEGGVIHFGESVVFDTGRRSRKRAAPRPRARRKEDYEEEEEEEEEEESEFVDSEEEERQEFERWRGRKEEKRARKEHKKKKERG